MAIIKYKKIAIFVNFFFLFFTVFSGIYLTYNIYHANNFNKQYIEKVKDIYASTKRFGPYYNNADSRYLKKGIYEKNRVSVVVNKASNAKILYFGIRELRSQLNQLTNNNIWTIAVLDNPLDYSYFDPIRPQYIKRYTHSALQEILKNEELIDTYQNFYGCNIKLTEIYTEKDTDARIRTLYYPIYNNKKLNSMLIVDIEENIFSESINSYNTEHMTIINDNHQGNIYEVNNLLPCSIQDPIHIGINFFSLLKFTFFPAILFAFLSHYLIILTIQRKHSIRYDKMTNFYRRDFYEKKLQKQQNFCLLLIDIDHFKKINDQYGHDVGDEVIRLVTTRISHYIREEDAAIRWGGEEFLLTFKRAMNKKQLLLRAENVRKNIESSSIAGVNVSVSIGGVVMKNSSFNEAYKKTDNALYHSKNSGRNQSTIL